MSYNRFIKTHSRMSATLAAVALIGFSLSSAPVRAAIVDEPAPNAATQPAPKASTRATKVSYGQAEKMVRAGNYKQGLAALKALNENGNANAWNLMGFSSRKLGDLKNAERYYKAALKINPKHRGALEYYGELMVQKGNAKGAMTHLASLKAVCGNCAEYGELRQTMKKAGMAVN